MADRSGVAVGVLVSVGVVVGVVVVVGVAVLVGVVVEVGVVVGVAVLTGVVAVLIVGDGGPAVGDGVLAVGVGDGAISGSTPAGLVPDWLVVGPDSTPIGTVQGSLSTWAEERALDGCGLGPELLTELAGVMGCSTRPSAKAPATTMATAPATARTGRSPTAAGPRRMRRPIAASPDHATEACARRRARRDEASRCRIRSRPSRAGSTDSAAACSARLMMAS